jgi:RNA polymerase sigma-70 factor (ECF subfamily)
MENRLGHRKGRNLPGDSIMNEKEFVHFVENTKGIVLAAVRKYLPADLYHAIDDVAQETYLRIYRSIKKAAFPEDDSRNNWIYTIAKNESLRMVEKSNREDVRIRQFIESMGADEHIDEVLSDEIVMIREVISSLPDKYRVVFELLVMGFSERQIAEKLSMKRGTIKSRIHRGKELIFRNLSVKGVFYES